MRVERTARTGKKAGHTVSFVGPFVNNAGFPIELFEKFYILPFNKYANAKIPPYWGALKRKFAKILDECNPNLIHAHNIIAAKLASEFSIPFIYDDHEYASKQCKVNARIWKPNKMYIHWLWSRWEKEVLRKTLATITVSMTIAEEHKKYCDRVVVTPNFPSSTETEKIRQNFRNNDHLSSVYVGNDFSRSSELRGTHRDVEGFLQLFHHKNIGTLTVIGDVNLPSLRNVYSLGFLPHSVMMEELMKHHIGLLPRKKHWYHQYSNPNKPYEYAHAGLLVLTSSDFVNVKDNLGRYCRTFSDPYELKELLLHYAKNLNTIYELKPKIREFAAKNLTWENRCEPRILGIYSKL
jgi:glycosyltransferase involved in cell wall biosynthesis